MPTAIDLARKNAWPLIVHLEFNEIGETDAARAMTGLRKVLGQNADIRFGLIHMAQLEPEEARKLIEDHGNVFFLTSSADQITQRATEKLAKTGAKAQTGWINMFAQGTWKPAWKTLISDHPDRFVLAFDNVFPPHWKKRYVQKVKFWRDALGELPADIARRVACENAARLWQVDTAC